MSCPWFAAALVPTDDVTDSTSGFFVTIRATASCARISASYEAPCAASVVPSSCPVSPLGKSPLGMTTNRMIVATRITPEKISVAPRRCITQSRLRS